MTFFMSVWMSKMQLRAAAEKLPYKTCQKNGKKEKKNVSKQLSDNLFNHPSHQSRTEGEEGKHPGTMLNPSTAKTRGKALLTTPQINHRLRVHWLFVKTHTTHPNDFC